MPDTTTTAPIAAYARALTLGVVTGLRSQTGLAAIALAAQPGGPYASLAQAPTPWRLISTRASLITLALAAAGEFVGDKLSVTPDRTKPLPLTGRLAFGALAGGLACRALGHSAAIGGALGALGALGGSFGGYTYRTGTARLTGAPDLPLAIAEDATAAGVALAATRR
jgi:uncharacterized membrane protein